MDLKRFLKPKSIAVVGATEKDGFAGGTCKNIMQYSQNLENVYFVNPKYDAVYGKKCYKSLSEIEDNLDAVIIATPKSTVLSLIKQAKEKGAAGVVVYASGYSEIGTEEAKKEELELVRLCRDSGLALMGPNCCGFVNYIDEKYCWAIHHSERDRRGKVGFVSQSGQIAMSLMDSPDMTFSYCISCGNSKVVSEEEYLEFLVDDPTTKVVAMYMEGVNDPRRFELCLKKAALMRKPIVVLKVGRSERASAIAASHTGSMSGADASFDAVFKKFGVIRVDDMQDLIGTSLLLANLRTYPNKMCNYAAICLSGGETAICADEGLSVGIRYADFEDGTVKKLRDLLPFYATPRNNPLDITATPAYQPEVLAETLMAVLNDNNVDMVLFGFTLMDEIVDDSFYIMYEGMEKALKQTKKPFACLNFIEMSRNRDLVSRFTSLGVPVLPCTKYAFSALRHLNDFVAYDASKRSLDLALPDHDLNGRKALSEFESKKLLLEQGITLHLGKVAKNIREAIEIARELGFPVVAKVDSGDILHKSDVGGVKLNLKSEEELSLAYDEILENAVKHVSHAQVKGVLIQRMMSPGKEIIIGVRNDSQFGPMLMVGMGGVFVEVFKDIALYPAPLNKFEAMEMLSSLKSFKLMKGYRGQSPDDIEALADILVKISDFAVKNKNYLVEMDMNPLFLYPKGKNPEIVDALVIVNE